MSTGRRPSGVLRAYLHGRVHVDADLPDVVRSAVRTLTHAVWEPAVPAVVGLLDHPHPAVRTAAVDGLARMGRAAVPALRHAADHARPDKRSLYTAVLDRITAHANDGSAPIR